MVGGPNMVSAEREPLRGLGGFASSGVQGQNPWLGVKGAKLCPPEADTILAVWDCFCELNLNLIFNFIEFVMNSKLEICNIDKKLSKLTLAKIEYGTVTPAL